MVNVSGEMQRQEMPRPEAIAMDLICPLCQVYCDIVTIAKSEYQLNGTYNLREVSYERCLLTTDVYLSGPSLKWHYDGKSII